MVVVAEVYRECERDHVVDIETLLLTVGLHVEKELVFGGERLVPLDVIDELLVAELAQSLEVDAVAERFPLEVEQVWSVCLLPCREIALQKVDFLLAVDNWIAGSSDLPGISSGGISVFTSSVRGRRTQLLLLARGRRSLNLGHVAGKSALHHSAHYVAVVALQDDKLKRRHLAWLVVIRRDLSVLSMRVFPRLHESLALLFQLCVDVGQLLGRELAHKLSQQLPLVVLQVFGFLLWRPHVTLGLLVSVCALSNVCTGLGNLLLSILVEPGIFGLLELGSLARLSRIRPRLCLFFAKLSNLGTGVRAEILLALLSLEL